MTEPTAPEAEAPSRTLRVGLALALAVLTAFVFAPASEHGFLNYDDDEYVAANAALAEGLTPESVRWAFTTFHAANWHPLTWLSHALDVELFGLDPGAHHRTSVLLHAAGAALWFLALVALTGATWTSLLVAAVFALHPLRVESVAWVAERKDVLAGGFFALALFAWASWTRRGGALRYLGVALAMAASLMSKPMAVTLPFVLILLDRWPLARAAPLRRLVVEKLPLFALAVASSLVTLRAQRAGGALESLEQLPFLARAANAADAYVTYVVQTLWPRDLAVLYPHPGALAPEASLGLGAWLDVLVLLAVTAGCLALLRRTPAPTVGWLWFLGTLVPVIGLVQVGLQAHADRYTYVPTIGLVLGVAFGARALLRERPLAAHGTWIAGAVWLAALVPGTHRQLATWRSTITVMEHAIEVTTGNFMAHANLGEALERAGRLEEAVEHYEEALRIKPDVALVQYNLGNALGALGRYEEAVGAYERALAGMPGLVDAHVNAGVTLALLQRDAQALPHLEAAWAGADPDSTYHRLPTGQALAWVLATSHDGSLRDGVRAVGVARACIELGGASSTLLDVLAAAHAEAGDFASALHLVEAAIETVPSTQAAPLRERARLYRERRPYHRPPPPR